LFPVKGLLEQLRLNTEPFMTVAPHGCRHCIVKGNQVVRSRLLHGLLIGSAIVGLLFLV